jgi:uncharacterized protein (DUF3820 family)
VTVLPLYEVATTCGIRPRALVRLLDMGLPHTVYQGDYIADLDEVRTWLATQHAPGRCGQFLQELERTTTLAEDFVESGRLRSGRRPRVIPSEMTNAAGATAALHTIE